MYKFLFKIIIIIFLNQCSLDTKTGFWTKSQNIRGKKKNLEEIFKSEKILEKEFNPNLKIKINSSL